MVAVFATVATMNSTAAAHEGETEFVAEIDGYYVEVSDNVVPDLGLWYTLFLRDLDTGRPVEDATAEITARAGNRVVGPITAVHLLNAHSVLILDQGVVEWTVDVRIDHPQRGRIDFTHTLAGAGAPGGSSSWWTRAPAVVAVWTLPVIGLYVLHRAAQRRRASR